MAGASAPVRRIIVGAAGEPSCTGGPGAGCPMGFGQPEGQSVRPIAPVVREPSRAAVKLAGRDDDLLKTPGCGAGR